MGRSNIIKSVQMKIIPVAGDGGTYFPHLPWVFKSHSALVGRHLERPHTKNATVKEVETTMIISVARCTVRSAKTR